MCTDMKIVNISEICEGRCNTESRDVSCHSKESSVDIEDLAIEELKQKVRSLRVRAMETASQLHDLAEEKLPEGWKEIPEIAQKAYEAHKEYFKWKSILDNYKR
ncbi:MAG: CCE_0567 family metalloprotein [Hydrogenothermaceae bacterium]|nr:CCE_0567 family metalloprotein [Hydrogenothermaceae bacterium]